jgi:hypothetical protein
MSEDVYVDYEKFHMPEDEVEMVEFMKQSLE